MWVAVPQLAMSVHSISIYVSTLSASTCPLYQHPYGHANLHQTLACSVSNSSNQRYAGFSAQCLVPLELLVHRSRYRLKHLVGTQQKPDPADMPGFTVLLNVTPNWPWLAQKLCSGQANQQQSCRVQPCFWVKCNKTRKWNHLCDLLQCPNLAGSIWWEGKSHSST